MHQTSISLPSFAKINWSLHIVGRRADGYHEIRTQLQTISLHDDLHFEVTDDGGISLGCDEPDVPSDDQNLIVRAAAALKTRYQVPHGVRVHLEKRIPAKAGLGGASSNAAISLLALTHLWNVKATPAELLEIGATLGADVPFFLWGGRALATGTGATVFPVPQHGDDDVHHLVVITPKSSISTAKAYAAVGSPPLTTFVNEPILSSSRGHVKTGYLQPWPAEDSLENDFECVIFDIEPEIRRTKESLLQAGALGALLAGSGSSVFGIFAGREEQQRAVNEIKLEAGWRIFPCVTVSRDEYLRALNSWDIPILRSFNSGSDIGA
ncbi:MAG: 4-(cytidine 5'-diphospho)-2-C-methyl-D-erythritol kinase [Acidobacteriota bacterium]